MRQKLNQNGNPGEDGAIARLVHGWQPNGHIPEHTKNDLPK